MPYLLDTNCWVQYLKQSNTPIRARLQALQPADIVTCSVVRAELLHGAEKYGNRDRRVAAVFQTLAPFRSLTFDALEVAGAVIGPYDLQIAAICVVHGLTLVTSNTSEFSRIGGLKVEDWLQAP